MPVSAIYFQVAAKNWYPWAWISLEIGHAGASQVIGIQVAFEFMVKGKESNWLQLLNTDVSAWVMA